MDILKQDYDIQEYLENDKTPPTEIILAERIKCRLDPLYFMTTYIKLDFGGHKIPFRPRKKQIEILDAILNHHYVLIHGSRQVGKTQMVENFILWLCMFFDNYPVYVACKDGNSTSELIRDIYNMYENLPKWLVPKTVVSNVLKKEWENKSRIMGVIFPPGKEEKAARGMRGGFIFIDEVAFTPGIEKLFTALMPVTSFVFKKYEEFGLPYGVVLASTANGKYGLGEFWYKLWTDTLQGKTIFKPIFYHYTDVPEYANDPNFKEKKIKELGGDVRKFNQEYEGVFLGTEDAFLPDEIIAEIQKIEERQPIEVFHLTGGKFYLYREIDPNHLYCIGIDTATESDKGSKSAICLYDYDTEEVIGYFEDRCNALDFLDSIVNLLQKLKLVNFILIPENNTINEPIVAYFKQSPEYRRHLWFDPKQLKKMKKLDYDKLKFGVNTNKQSRQLIFDAIYKYVVVEEKYKKIYPNKLLNELVTLEIKKGRVQAPPGFNDDLVMAFGFIQYAITYTDFDYFLQRIRYSTSGDKAFQSNLEFIKKLWFGNKSSSEIGFGNQEDDKQFRNGMLVDIANRWF